MQASKTFLGIDYGTKRIGVAISDENGTLAFPKGIVANDSKALESIGDIIKEKNVLEIVVGESLDLQGLPNKVMREVGSFIEALKDGFHLPVHLEKEFLTSVYARGNAGKDIFRDRKVKKEKTGKVDASAAALILQRYLDKRNNLKK